MGPYKEHEKQMGYTTEYYSAIEENEILPCAATKMDLEGFMLSEISQTKRNPV